VPDVDAGVLDRQDELLPGSTSNDFSPSTVTVGMSLRLPRGGDPEDGPA